MEKKKELEQKILAYQILQARLESLNKQREFISSKLLEIQSTLQSIEEVKKSGENTLFSIGSNAHVYGKIVNKEKMIVEIGANVALEKTFEEGRSFLEKRKKELEDALSETEKNIQEIINTLNELGPQIERLSKDLQSGQAG